MQLIRLLRFLSQRLPHRCTLVNGADIRNITWLLNGDVCGPASFSSSFCMVHWVISVRPLTITDFFVKKLDSSTSK